MRSCLILTVLACGILHASAFSLVLPLDGEWLLATDPQNNGQAAGWPAAPAAEATRTKVPWIIQEAFPGYHGVAWYWRAFEAPANPDPEGALASALLGRRLPGGRVAQRHPRRPARGRRESPSSSM